MKPFPGLSLSRCTLVPFGAKHLTQRYVGWLNDAATMQYSEQRHRTHDLESCRAYAASFAHSDDLFIAIEANDPALGHVGNMSVAVDRPNSSADVSIVIGEPSVRGTGIGREAWAGLVDWLLGAGGLRRVTAGTMATNTAMVALMRQSGMDIDAVRPRAFVLGGVEVDLVLASRFANGGHDANAKDDRNA